MGGGLMQLVAYGAQDIYLTGNPQITFFKVVYRRHTNFSMEAIEQTINGTVANNARVTVTVSRNGDLVGRCYLQSTCASTQVLNSAVTNLSSVELEIGGQRIDKQSGHWMEVWAELTENKTGRAVGTNFQTMSGYGAAVANNTANAATDAAVGSQCAFILVDQASAIQWTPLQFWFCRNPGLALPLIALQYHEVKLIFNFASAVTHDGHKVWCEYIYLDTDERRRFAQVSHEYLIEQVQEQSVSASTSQQSEDLNFNHPVKELVWAGGFSSGALTPFAGAQSETVLLKLNGHDRFSAREARYFSKVQVYQHHSAEGGFVDMSLGVYSFALKPEEHQPSGTCNFSRIDNAQLTKTGAARALEIFAVNYNVLRVMSGMGGLAYSN